MTNSLAINKLLELAQGHIISKCVMLAAQFRLDDLLKDGCATITDLAYTLQIHPKAMTRFIRVLAACGVVQLIDENTVKATDSTPYLNRILSPHIIDGYVVFNEFESSLKTNQACWSKVFGKDFYPHLVDHPEKLTQFQVFCSKTAADWFPAIFELYDFAKYKKLVDVGGGQGFLINALLEKYPYQEGILFDKPEVIKGAESIVSQSAKSRLQLIGGDFFEVIPKGGDLYILCRTLLNWDDNDAIKIINNCHSAMSNDATLLIIDFVVPDASHAHFLRGALNDLNLFACVNSGNRTEKEWRSLVDRTPLSIAQFYITQSSSKSEPFTPMCVIEVKKMK